MGTLTPRDEYLRPMIDLTGVQYRLGFRVSEAEERIETEFETNQWESREAVKFAGAGDCMGCAVAGARQLEDCRRNRPLGLLHPYRPGLHAKPQPGMWLLQARSGSMPVSAWLWQALVQVRRACCGFLCQEAGQVARSAWCRVFLSLVAELCTRLAALRVCAAIVWRQCVCRGRMLYVQSKSAQHKHCVRSNTCKAGTRVHTLFLGDKGLRAVYEALLHYVLQACMMLGAQVNLSVLHGGDVLRGCRLDSPCAGLQRHCAQEWRVAPNHVGHAAACPTARSKLLPPACKCQPHTTGGSSCSKGTPQAALPIFLQVSCSCPH